MAGRSHSGKVPGSDSSAGRLAVEVAAQHAALLAKLREELAGGDPEAIAEAAVRLARGYGEITAAAVEATVDSGASSGADPSGIRSGAEIRPASDPDVHAPAAAITPPLRAAEELGDETPQQLASLYRPGHMRRRLDQLVETNRRYEHPFGLVVFDASGPGTRDGDVGGGAETVLAILGAALRDSIRIVDEAFRLEEEAICVLAPNLRTVEAVQMAGRLLGLLDELERAGGLRIAVAAGVVACPEHGTDADQLLKKADAALWRARAVGQPVGVGALEPVQDR